MIIGKLLSVLRVAALALLLIGNRVGRRIRRRMLTLLLRGLGVVLLVDNARGSGMLLLEV